MYNEVKEILIPNGYKVENFVRSKLKQNAFDEDEYFFINRNNPKVRYHLFPVFDYSYMKDLGFTFDEINEIDYILAPEGEDTPNGDMKTWFLFDYQGRPIYIKRFGIN